MLVHGKPQRTIWLAEEQGGVEIIDQTQLPFHFSVVRLSSLAEAVTAIASMQVRGAPLIGATAAYGLCLGLHHKQKDAHLHKMGQQLIAARPTAVNLRWAVERMLARLLPLEEKLRLESAYAEAALICDEDAANNERIGEHGALMLEALWRKKGGSEPLNVLTHCNAGWLATVDWGTALAPIYKAAQRGLPLHVWVDETRPRNQGAALTAWELNMAGIAHHLIADNAGGHLMQKGLVDCCLVGSDRTTATGDVCNKIGTYLKALAAADNKLPFYVALPGSTIDWRLNDGLGQIPIETRGQEEVLSVQGRDADGRLTTISIAPEGTPACNPAFDVTPARLVTGLITERGVCAATSEGLRGLYPEQAHD